MALKVEHELHTRRFGRNFGVGMMLVGFIAIVFGLTMVKVQNTDFTDADGQVTSPASGSQLEGSN